MICYTPLSFLSLILENLLILKVVWHSGRCVYKAKKCDLNLKLNCGLNFIHKVGHWKMRHLRHVSDGVDVGNCGNTIVEVL
jgi:hypothetical protein